MFPKLPLFVCINLLFFSLISLPDQSYGQTERKVTQPKSQKKVEVKSESSDDNKSSNNRVKKVMIVDFDARGINKWWQGNWDIGNLFANTFVGPMSRTNSFEVVERERMKEIFFEQGLSEDERFKPSNITKIGRLLGADLILFGYLTDFSRKRKNRIVYKEVYAQISFSVRLVDVANGKVVDSAEIMYKSPKQKETTFFSEDKDFNPNDPEFFQSIFGQAITESSKLAIERLSGEKINDETIVVDAEAKATSATPTNAVATAPTNTPVTGIIADVTGKNVIINKGSDHGIQPGQTFAVVKVVKEVKDPKTGKVIFKKTEEIARIKITSVHGAASEGIIISGAADALSVGTEVETVN